MLVKLINFLNGKPKFNIDPIHLYMARVLRALKKRYLKNNNIGPIYLHVPLKNSGITYKLNKSLLVRNYSNLPLTTKSKESIASPGISSNTKEMQNFYTWFSGFTDAEGSFYIAISKTCSFRFQINLHKDDLNVLYYIQRSLGFGEVRLYDNYASFTITRLKDIAQLVDIFKKYPLQGSKWLNYQDFASAFDIYIGSKDRANALKETLRLKNNMNRLRLDYALLEDKLISITPYWLLGFIEGEGCFSINKHNNYRLDFSLCQSSTNFELMKSIKLYLENLPGVLRQENNYRNALGISEVRSNNPNHQSTTRIETTRIPFITNILIPFLDSLTWQSKKKLDFQDWKIILKLKEEGHHLSEQGRELIDLILSQTNNNRLSTSSNDVVVDREQLLVKVNELLNGPSNFEIRNDRKFVISLNKYYHSSRLNVRIILVDEKGNTLHCFDSLADCAKFLKVDASTISKRKSKGIPFIFENKTVYIKNDKIGE